MDEEHRFGLTVHIEVGSPQIGEAVYDRVKARADAEREFIVFPLPMEDQPPDRVKVAFHNIVAPSHTDGRTRAVTWASSAVEGIAGVGAITSHALLDFSE